MRKLFLFLTLSAALIGSANAAFQQGPFPWPFGVMAAPEQVSADSVSNLVVTSVYGALVSATIKIGATSGYLMIFDAAALPSNGTVAPKFCLPVTSNATNGMASISWNWPAGFTTGIVLAFSTTGCDSLTASATAKFMAQAF